jgi:hypothetical protein
VKSTIFLIFTLVFLFYSCEKKIDFPLKTSEALLSVDASIETENFPVVVLTRSLNYFSKISLDVLSESMIDDAVVTINNGEKTITLKKFTTVFPGDLKYVFYSCDSTDEALDFKGEEGKRYVMKIKWNNREYEATTTIPFLRKTLDSLWWEKTPGTPDTSNRVSLKGKFTDPPQFGDYIRYYTRVNNEPYFPGINSAFDDLFVNGTTYIIDIPKGVDKNLNEDIADEQFFRRGDTVSVKLSGIDKNTFEFWRTVEFSFRSTNNPFSSPVKILSNISNGAIGYFGGYSSRFKTIIIPRL